jgi:hypothetical protein
LDRDEEAHVREPDEGRDAVPLGQRLYDNWWLLLIAGLAVMLITYTAWGLVEILTLPQAPLP